MSEGRPHEGSSQEAQSGQPHVTLPAERLYWAVLDPRPLGRSRIADSEMGFLFEDSLPVPIETVHARFARLADGRAIACGIDREALERLDRARLLSVTPDRIPEPVRDLVGESAALDAADFNLLVGAYEPVAVRSVRRRAGLVAASLLGASLILLSIGVLRRGHALDRATAAVEGHRAEILRIAYPSKTADGTPAGGSDGVATGIPPELRLLGEVRRLASTRSSELPELPDAAPGLAAIVAAWPEGVEARCDAITVNERGASLRGIVKDNGAVIRLEDAYRNVPGWKLVGSVQFNNQGATPTFTATLERADAVASNAAGTREGSR
jgi:hypothetical protein